MKKLLLSLAIVLSMGLSAAYASEESTTPMPSASVEPSVMPVEESIAPSLPASTVVPMFYAIKNVNGNYMMLKYSDGNFTLNLMQIKRGDISPMRNEYDHMYFPFRYLFEVFNIKELNDDYKNEYGIPDDSTIEINTTNSKNITDYLLNHVSDSGVFIWGNNGHAAIVVLNNENKTTKEFYAPEADKEIDENGNAAETINREGRLYLQILALSDICTIQYSTDLGYAYVIPQILNGVELETVAQNIESKLSNIGDVEKVTTGDNYTTYSDWYSYDDKGVWPLSKVFHIGDGDKKIYCVNQLGDLLIFVDADNDFHSSYVSTKTTGNIGSIKEIKTEKGENIITDFLAFDGTKIYGIRVENPGEYIGDLFCATLDVKQGVFYANNYKSLAGVKASTPYINGNHCYYIDRKDNEKIKRVSKDDFSNPETLNGEPDLETISHYNILNTQNKQYIMYRNYKTKDVCIGLMDGSTVKKQYTFNGDNGGINVADIRGILNNGKDTFYFIVTAENGKEFIWKIKLEQDGNFTAQKVESIQNTTYNSTEGNDKIRNLTIKNGKLYAKINDEPQLILEEVNK